MESLRVLEVAEAKLKLLWQHESQAPLQLRELKIWAPSFSNFPRSIGQLKQLEKITIFQALIKTVPEEFCDLRSLKYLELIKCSKMMSLPDSFGNLTNLHYIDLSGALSLQLLPKSFGNLTRLEHLGLRDCSSLTFSNETFGNITTLEHIDISGCGSVTELPPQVAHQRSLQILNVCKTNLKELPSGIGDVCKLEALELGGEPLLEILPSLLGCLKSLKELWLFNCPELKCLPDDFGRLTQLMELKIWNCGIEYLPQELMGMKNLEILVIEDCPLLGLPFKKAEGELDFSDGKCMLKLKLLKLAGTQLSELFFQGGVCPNLQYLSLERCSELRGIEGLCRLAKLQYLYVSPGVKVEALPGVEQHMKSCKEPDLINEFVELNELRLAHFTDAMLYVNKCPEILETGCLRYLRYPSKIWVTLG